jgi:hypothetical protein
MPGSGPEAQLAAHLDQIRSAAQRSEPLTRLIFLRRVNASVKARRVHVFLHPRFLLFLVSLSLRAFFHYEIGKRWLLRNNIGESGFSKIALNFISFDIANDLKRIIEKS